MDTMFAPGYYAIIYRSLMTEISRFLGMIVRMPDTPERAGIFQVQYDELIAEFSVDTLETVTGDLTPTAIDLIIEWADAHRRELRENWQRALTHQKLIGIQGLE